MDQILWFKSISEIPGINWEPLILIDRQQLKHAESFMKVEDSELSDRKNIWWYDKDGKPFNNSWSPSHNEWGKISDEMSIDRTVKVISTALILPGTPSDYHFGITSAVEILYKKRKESEKAIDLVEKLCLLDISMIESLPQIAEPKNYNDDHWNPGQFPVHPSYRRLITIYMKEGLLEDAVDLEKRLISFTGEEPKPQGPISKYKKLNN